MDIFDFLKYILDCTYISDLRTQPYNTKAKLILERLYFNDYSVNDIRDAFEYLYTNIK